MFVTKLITFGFVSLSTSLNFHPIPLNRETSLYDITFDQLGTGKGVIDSLYPDLVQLYGVPYAYPPIDERRFRIPKLMDSWDAQLNFDEYKPMCMQLLFVGNAEWTPGVSEDCLYLNIFVPKQAIENPSAKYPVVVYFHGGAYFFG